MRIFSVVVITVTLAIAGCGVAYQAGTELRTQHMRDSLKAGESMPEIHDHFGEPDIRTDESKDSEIWSYATRANSNDLAATLFYTSAKEGDKGHFMDLKFVNGRLVSWKEATHTMPSKRSTGINYGFTAGPGAQSVTHF